MENRRVVASNLNLARHDLPLGVLELVAAFLLLPGEPPSSVHGPTASRIVLCGGVGGGSTGTPSLGTNDGAAASMALRAKVDLSCI